jgi:2-desacetyl-2-hydroxyethyl bacteriochlorophyllide A dehydrogenase
MLAALLLEPGRVEVDEVADPEPGAGEVRISVRGVGLCGSDMSVFSGKWKAPRYPWIMGHEAYGVIEAVGREVDPSREGELVAVEPNIACEACPQCARDRTSACENRISVGMNRQGALAERLVVPASRAWPIADLEPRDLVCVEPFTVVETALRRLPTAVPDRALVVGVGAQGLLMSLALQRHGASVHVTDVNGDRVSFAMRALGVAETAPDDGLRFPLVVDTSGVPAAMAEAVARAEVGATIIELGLDDRPFGLDAVTLVRRQLVLRGSLTYDHPRDFAWSTALINEGTVAPGRVISHEFSFTDAHSAFEAGANAPGKTWIRLPDASSSSGV